MKLLSVALARSLWFVDVSELNPGGKDIFAHLLPALVDDYRFKVFPTEGEDFSQGIKLQQGEFVKEDGTVLSLNVTIFQDGIAADTYASTEDSDDFLEEAFQGLSDLGFVYDPGMIRRKAYLSHVNVTCAKPLSLLNPKLDDLAIQISSALGGSPAFGFAAIEFWPDQTQVYKPSTFSFQKRVGDHFEDNRYWSQAPLPTNEHLKLLDDLETMLN